MDTSEFIKKTRSKLGFTQEEFAEKIGSKRCNIANYETGRAMPPGDIILKIQQMLSNKANDELLYPELYE